MCGTHTEIVHVDISGKSLTQNTGWMDEKKKSSKVSYGGCVLKNASAMIAEREALRKGIEHLTVLFPTVVSSFHFQVENSGRTVQYKLNAQSLRLFGLHSDVNDESQHRRAPLANEGKQTRRQPLISWPRLQRTTKQGCTVDLSTAL